MQHTIDPHADLQAVFLRFDMHVGRTHLHRIFKQRLQQAHHRRAFGAHGGRELAKVHRVANVFFQSTGQAADFFGAPVQAVKGCRQLALGHRSNRDVALEDAGELVVSEYVQRVRQGHQQSAALVFQRQRFETTRRRLGQQLDDIGPKRKGLEVDKRNSQLPRQAIGQQFFGDDAGFYQQAPHLFASRALQLERLLELLHGDQLLLHQHVPQAQLLGAARRRTRCFWRCGRARRYRCVHALILVGV